MKLLLAILLLSSPAFADYDAKTGNYYNTVGNTTTGTNANTGSTWTETNDATSIHGIDSNGNYYNYDKKTGNYYNTSGKTCYGKGAARQCY